jgi:hypothetical protein
MSIFERFKLSMSALEKEPAIQEQRSTRHMRSVARVCRREEGMEQSAIKKGAQKELICETEMQEKSRARSYSPSK